MPACVSDAKSNGLPGEVLTIDAPDLSLRQGDAGGVCDGQIDGQENRADIAADSAADFTLDDVGLRMPTTGCDEESNENQ
jgi:hypothetical protein